MHCLPPVNSKFHSQLCNQLLVTEVPDRTEDKSVRSIEDLVHRNASSTIRAFLGFPAICAAFLSCRRLRWSLV